MPVQTVTLTIPETVYRRAKQAADVLQRPVEEVIVDTLASSLPLLDDVPAEMAGELAAMAYLSDEALEGLANNMMLESRQTTLHELLDKQGRGQLSEADQQALAALMAEYGRHMLRRAKAVALLIDRGRPVPTLVTLPAE